jgi:hypothetical protein
MFRVLQLLDILEPAADLSGLKACEGEILCEKEIEVAGLMTLARERELSSDANRTKFLAERYALVVASIQHVHAHMRPFIPADLGIDRILAGVFATVLNQKSHGHCILSLLGIPGLVDLLQHLHVKCEDDNETGAVIRCLAQSGHRIEIQDAGNPEGEPRDDTILIVLDDPVKPTICHGGRSVPATIDPVMKMFGRLSAAKPWTEVVLNMSTGRLDLYDCHGPDCLEGLPGLNSEQRLWLMSSYFSSVPT